MSLDTVFIHPKAKIGKGNNFGNWVTIGENVTIGDGNKIGDCVSITGRTSIGNENVIGSGSVFGAASNHILRKKTDYYLAENTFDKYINIGNDNIFSDGVTVHSPVVFITHVGNGINVGTRSHIAHDDVLEDNVIINAHCSFGGYVKVLKGANIGASVSIHPRLVVGQYSMLGMGSVIIRHIIPGSTVVGNPQKYLKPNIVGMKRNNLSDVCIDELSYILKSERIDINSVSKETRDILGYFFGKLNGEYVREVSTVPPLFTPKEGET
ncbi:MAG: hypothetical protein KJZ77_12985 [Anaerolineales bacterium]|nr:hypothetical protein [Anaerolineales bacterium]